VFAVVVVGPGVSKEVASLSHLFVPILSILDGQMRPSVVSCFPVSSSVGHSLL
jgi:hypothetical protein